MRALRSSFSEHRVEVLATLGLVCLYLAVMSGHFLSIDGLTMWRQALAMTYHHSWTLVPPIWWSGPINSSYRGVGASLQYSPSLLVFFWLSGHVPVQLGSQYDYKLFYGDLLYVVAGGPVWVLITAITAYLVGGMSRLLGAGTREALWAVAFFGLGSPAFAASRGDWPQPLVALCWAAGFYACLRYVSGGGQRWLWVSAAGIVYGVLSRPLEGSFLLPGVLLLLLPVWRHRPSVAAFQALAWVAGVALTLLFNWARFGGPLNFGYPSSVAWTTPIWVGFPSALLSPGRGVLWEFPALVLSALGAILLWRRGKRLEVLALVGVPGILFIGACQYFQWVGGWDWGFRFFQPALPLVAALAGVGVLRLGSSVRRWLPAVLLAGGILWNVPVVVTDLLGGYGPAYGETAANWRLDAYPPIGAWRFLHHVFPTHGADSSSIDIVWFRAKLVVGWISLLPFVVLLGGAVALWISAVRGAMPTPAGGAAGR